MDMLSLRTNMHQYYVQSDGIPQYINMLEDAQKKAKRAGMPIADIKLVMMASAARNIFPPKSTTGRAYHRAHALGWHGKRPSVLPT